MTIFGTDIASYQAGLDLAELTGVDFVLAKVTEGDSYVDPPYAGWRTAAAAAGKEFIWYHFLTQASTAQAQAANTLAHVGDPSLPGMVDVETEGASRPTLAQILAYIDACHAVGLRIKLAYLPPWYHKQVLGSPDLSPLTERGVAVISSNYPRSAAAGTTPTYAEDGGDTGPGWAAYGGVTPLLWQFADDAPEGGQKVDMNAYRGTLAELSAFLGVQVQAPPAEAAPAWPGRTLVYALGRTQIAGSDVRTWQRRMQARGWTIADDGQYGPKSEAVCRAFQTEFHTSPAPGLAIDGQVGVHTWAAAWTIPVTP